MEAGKAVGASLGGMDRDFAIAILLAMLEPFTLMILIVVMIIDMLRGR